VLTPVDQGAHLGQDLVGLPTTPVLGVSGVAEVPQQQQTNKAIQYPKSQHQQPFGWLAAPRYHHNHHESRRGVVCGPSALSGAVTGRAFHLWHNTVPSHVLSGHKRLTREHTAHIDLCSFLPQHLKLGTYPWNLERNLGQATLDRPPAAYSILGIAIRDSGSGHWKSLAYDTGRITVGWTLGFRRCI